MKAVATSAVVLWLDRLKPMDEDTLPRLHERYCLNRQQRRSLLGIWPEAVLVQ